MEISEFIRTRAAAGRWDHATELAKSLWFALLRGFRFIHFFFSFHTHAQSNTEVKSGLCFCLRPVSDQGFPVSMCYSMNRLDFLPIFCIAAFFETINIIKRLFLIQGHGQTSKLLSVPRNGDVQQYFFIIQFSARCTSSHEVTDQRLGAARFCQLSKAAKVPPDNLFSLPLALVGTLLKLC